MMPGSGRRDQAQAWKALDKRLRKGHSFAKRADNLEIFQDRRSLGLFEMPIEHRYTAFRRDPAPIDSGCRKAIIVIEYGETSHIEFVGSSGKRRKSACDYAVPVVSTTAFATSRHKIARHDKRAMDRRLPGNTAAPNLFALALHACSLTIRQMKP